MIDRLAGITLSNPVHIDISQSNDHIPSEDTPTEPKTNFTHNSNNPVIILRFATLTPERLSRQNVSN
jgi:hypothetical protein